MYSKNMTERESTKLRFKDGTITKRRVKDNSEGSH